MSSRTVAPQGRQGSLEAWRLGSLVLLVGHRTGALRGRQGSLEVWRFGGLVGRRTGALWATQEIQEIQEIQESPLRKRAPPVAPQGRSLFSVHCSLFSGAWDARHPKHHKPAVWGSGSRRWRGRARGAGGPPRAGARPFSRGRASAPCQPRERGGRLSLAPRQGRRDVRGRGPGPRGRSSRAGRPRRRCCRRPVRRPGECV